MRFFKKLICKLLTKGDHEFEEVVYEPPEISEDDCELLLKCCYCGKTKCHQ